MPVSDYDALGGFTYKHCLLLVSSRNVESYPALEKNIQQNNVPANSSYFSKY